MYLHIKVKGEYYINKNIPLYQIGQYSFKLKRKNDKIKSQYYMLHCKRSMKRTTIKFESICIFYNSTGLNLKLDAKESKHTKLQEGEQIVSEKKILVEQVSDNN